MNRAWRVFATGFCFFVFGLGGLTLAFLVFPVLNLVVRDPIVRRIRARETIAWTFRLFVGLMRAMGLLRYELVDFQKLDRRALLVAANHPSLIDTVFLLGFVPNSTCVVNDGLFRNPFTARPLRAAGFIRNGTGIDVIASCMSALESGMTVLIFPEGTRTPLNGTIRLQRGVAQIAVRAPHDITPVIIRCTPRTLTKGEKWWKVPARAPQFTLQVGDDIPARAFDAGIDGPAMAARRLTSHLQQYFTAGSIVHAVA